MTPRFITMKSPKDGNGETNGWAGGMPEDLRAREAVLSDLRETVAEHAEREENEGLQDRVDRGDSPEM